MNCLSKLKKSLQILVISCLALASSATANNPNIRLLKSVAPNGTSLVFIRNLTGYRLYCYIQGYQYFVDFYVNPQSDSRLYYEPVGQYYWECK